MLAVITAIAVPRLGNLLSRNYARTAATFFQGDLRQARYEARSRSNDTVMFCAIASGTQNDLINCNTINGFVNGWLWYYIDSDGNEVLLGKNYAVSQNNVTVSPLINFAVQINKNTTTLWNKDDGTRTEITIPFTGGGGPIYPAITFSDSNGKSSVVVFDETGRTSLNHN